MYEKIMPHTSPGMLQDLRTCRRCSQLNNCLLYHKAVESGDRVSSGLGDLFHDVTEHVTPAHQRFFALWCKLVTLEGKEVQEKNRQREIWCMSGWERERLGRCFSGMLLKPRIGNEPVKGTDGQYAHKFERSADHPSQTSLVDVPIARGDRVIVSDQEGKAVAIATGKHLFSLN